MEILTFEAESISYAVCKYFGIETGENSFGYIASWSQGKELKELRASLETINKTSGTLISDIERHYKEICSAAATAIFTHALISFCCSAVVLLLM